MKEETERHKLLVKRTVISLAAAIRVAAAGEKPRKKKKILHGGPAGVLQAISCLNIIEACMYSSGACWYFLWAKKTFFLLLDIDIIYNWKCTVDLRNEPGSFGPLFFFSILRWPSQWISFHSVLIRKRIHNFFMSAMIMSYVVWSNPCLQVTKLFFSSPLPTADEISYLIRG